MVCLKTFFNTRAGNLMGTSFTFVENKKHGPNEKQTKTPEKELNEMEISNLSDAEFKTLVIRMLKELSEDLSRIKKTQSEMKDALIEIENN